MKERTRMSSVSKSGGDAVYGLGFIGSAVYFLQHATSFWLVLVGLFKSAFWPAFLVYTALQRLHM